MLASRFAAIDRHLFEALEREDLGVDTALSDPSLGLIALRREP